MNIIKLDKVTKTYCSGEHVLNALDNVDLEVEEGKFVVILGPSGAGKSTLLNLLGGLDSPTSGTITVGGKDISTLNSDELADYIPHYNRRFRTYHRRPIPWGRIKNPPGRSVGGFFYRLKTNLRYTACVGVCVNDADIPLLYAISFQTVFRNSDAVSFRGGCLPVAFSFSKREWLVPHYYHEQRS